MSYEAKQIKPECSHDERVAFGLKKLSELKKLLTSKPEPFRQDDNEEDQTNILTP